MDARSFIFHAAYGSGCPVPGWTESLHVVPQADNASLSHTHRHSLQDVLAGHMMAAPRGSFLPARAYAFRVRKSGRLPRKAFFSSAHGDGEAGRPVRDTSATGIMAAVFEG